MCVQSSCLLSDVDVLMSKVHVLLSEINQKVSKCPVAPTQLLPRVGVILSEMELIVALSQSNSVDDGDDDESLDWDNYDYNHHHHIYYNNDSLSCSLSSLDDVGCYDVHDDVGGDYDDVGGDVCHYEVKLDVVCHDDGGGNENHDDVKDDHHDDDEGDDINDAQTSVGVEEDGNIADRVMLRRRSTNIESKPGGDSSSSTISGGDSSSSTSSGGDSSSSTTSGGDSPSSSTGLDDINPSISKQANLFINKMLMFISRIAPNNKFSKQKSEKMRRKKIVKLIHPELRMVWQNCGNIFPDVIHLPEESLMFPTVDWSKVNARMITKIPEPKAQPVHGVSEDPDWYTDRLVRCGLTHKWEYCPFKTRKFPFGQILGYATDAGVIPASSNKHNVFGYVWSETQAEFILHAEFPGERKENLKKANANTLKKTKVKRELR